MDELQTYGDLKRVIKNITLKQKGEKIIKSLIDFIPYLGAAKTTFDVMKAVMGRPDDRKTNTWLDKLDIDDEMSAIIDDTVENGFIQVITKTIEGEDDNKPLESDFNMNAKMIKYLKDKYEGRHVSGIQENKNKVKMKNLRNIIKETILETLLEVDPPSTLKKDAYVSTIEKDLADQTGSFKNINTKEKLEQLLNTITDKLSPEFKKSPLFTQAIISFYNKNK